MAAVLRLVKNFFWFISPNDGLKQDLTIKEVSRGYAWFIDRKFFVLGFPPFSCDAWIEGVSFNSSLLLNTKKVLKVCGLDIQFKKAAKHTQTHSKTSSIEHTKYCRHAHNLSPILGYTALEANLLNI